MSGKLENMDVLLIEDDEMLRELTRRMLKELNVRMIHEAADGREGIDRLMALPQPVGLILVDLMMPNLDGFGFIEWVRHAHNQDFRDIPIVILTGFADSANIKRAIKLGIQGFIDKPVSADKLARQLEKALTGKQMGPPVFR